MRTIENINQDYALLSQQLGHSMLQMHMHVKDHDELLVKAKDKMQQLVDEKKELEKKELEKKAKEEKAANEAKQS